MIKLVVVVVVVKCVLFDLLSVCLLFRFLIQSLLTSLFIFSYRGSTGGNFLAYTTDS